MINRETIDAIFNHLQVEDVVGEYVNLKRKGANFLGLCPFHDEKTPSFTVSPSKNIYKCFGCGKGGNGVDFLMELESMSYPEALRYIAKMYNIDVKETELSTEQKENQTKREGLYIIYDFASQYYYKQLLESSAGKNIGQTYLNQRGLSNEIRDQFQLGYAPESGDALKNEALLKNFSETALEDSGLLNSKKRDFFYNRLMFPIHNLSGKVVGFGGRIFGASDKGPKYINSAESDIYHKSKILYGFFQGKSAIRKKDQCILVEGYMDVLTMHQYGFSNVVAASGTSLTADHTRLIKRFTDHVTLMLDGDEAGVNAILRSIKILLEGDCRVKVLALPGGMDPDDYLKEHGADGLQIALDENQEDFLDFVISHYQKLSGNDPVSQANIVKEVVSYLSAIGDSILRSLYTRKAAETLSVDESVLVAETNKLINKNIKKSRLSRFSNAQEDEQLLNELHANPNIDPYSQKQTSVWSDEIQEADILRVLLMFGDLKWDDNESTFAEIILAEIDDVLELWNHQDYLKVLTHVKENVEQSKFPDRNYYLQHENPIIKQTCIDLTVSPFDYSDNWMKRWQLPLQNQKMPEENFLNDVLYSIKRFKLKKFELFLKNLHTKFIEFQSSPDAVSPEDFNLEIEAYKKILELRNALAESLNSVVLYKA